MRKIISVFQRNYDTDRLIRNEVVPGAEWVLAGEGVATRKYDGSACLISEGRFYKRYDAKKGKKPPEGFIPAQEEADELTGHFPGWLEVGDGPEDKWFRVAMDNYTNATVRILTSGTYEACGPHFQGNPEHFPEDTLVPHGEYWLIECPRYFDGIREFLRTRDIEGIVFWHSDGRMAKVKKKDYGLKRIPETS